jgi:hypothetical protein
VKPHTLSMSKVSLAMLCSYGFRGDVPTAPRPSGRPARVGTAVHLLAEEWFHGRMVPVIDTDIREDAHRIFDQLVGWLEPRRKRIIAVEFGVRYDAARDSAVLGPKRGDAGYGDVAATVVPGTLDVLLRGEDGVLENVDVKTGKKEYAFREQLYSQAVGVSRLYGENRLRVGFIYPRKTKCDEPEWEDLDEDRLDEEAGRIAKVMRRLPVAGPDRGDWCWRCDAREGCPAWQIDAA